MKKDKAQAGRAGRRAAMVDLHAHVLPGFDDGAKDWHAALAMCRAAAGDGIQTLTATPHFFRGLFPTPRPQEVRDSVRKLLAICKKGLVKNLELVVGADCHLHPEIIENLGEGNIPTINDSRYLLLELPEKSLPPRIEDLFFDLCVAGAVPIITHPERNKVFAKDPQALHGLLQVGTYAQVTAASLTGRFGETTRQVARQMVEHGLVQIIASDAHDPKYRPPILSEARRIAEEILGADLAMRMVREVPGAVVDNEPIRFPPPEAPRPKRRAWWRRALHRSRSRRS